MALRAVTFFTYRTQGGPRPWTQEELGVLRFIEAIKGKPLKNAQTVRINGKPRSISEANRADAFAWFAEMALDVIERELGTTAVVLVPVPDSKCVAQSQSSRTAKLAAAIASTSSAVTKDILCWAQIMTPSSSGGPRRAENLYPHLAIRSRYAPGARPHVLIDDVETTGGHLRACAALLRAYGSNVALAISAAQTEPNKQNDPFAMQVKDLEDYVP